MRRGGIKHPARLVPLAFLAMIALGTALLMLPVATVGPGGAPFLTALFTSTSAVCVTGLVVVDTPTYWSTFGQIAIMGLFQAGGFGIMTGATLLALLVAGRLNLGARLVAHAETRTGLGNVTGVIKIAIVATLVVELTTAVVLSLRLRTGYGMDWGEAAWHGLFQSVSAFNNAGFSTWSDSLTRFADDPVFIVPITLAVLIGGLGFPVMYELRRNGFAFSRWTLHTKITVVGSGLLVAAGALGISLYEWRNPETLGALDATGKWTSVMFHSVAARTSGFNTIDMGATTIETQAINWVLMFIGGGSASTAGGIRVTTFFLLGLAVWAEVSGNRDTVAFRRRIPEQSLRLAVAVVLMALTMLAVGTLALLSVTDFPLQDVLFEAISAGFTVGLSTGITAQMPPAGQAILVALMFVGRVGLVTLAIGLAMRGHTRLYRYPEERPIVG
ncbi:MAG: TrkH family potassium uptake protein [Pseudomonadota bacterium]|nr:TrkH family potassium uptake protein [Pseudomonadota bacterium]